MHSTTVKKLTNALGYFNSGKLANAEKLCTQVIKHIPEQPDALNILGVIALRKEQYQRAISQLGKAISIRPQEPLYHYNIGLAYTKAFHFEEAIKSFHTVLKIKPDFQAVYSDLCHVLTETNDINSALKAGLSAIEYEPNNPKAHNNIAVAYEAQGDYESATNHYKTAVELAPNDPVLLKNLGNTYLGIGNKESAEKCYRKAIQLEPSFGEPYLQLSHIRKYTSADHIDVETLRTKIDDKTVNDIDRCDIYFALGKILDDCRIYDEAFEQFHQANSLASKRYSFQPERFKQYISSLIEFFSYDFMVNNEFQGDSVTEPIFIIGMPRSGTTLVEQILASHPQVYGAGELLWFGQLERRLPKSLESSTIYPQCLESMKPDFIQALSQEYLQYIHNLSNGQYRVTDKMPENFLRIGLIKLLFKKAKFIYCRRQPMDVGLSIYTQRFAGSIHWGYDLYNIGFYYAQHKRIMRHWLNIFDDSIHIVDYEELVQSQETASQDIIKFLDLPWDTACLEYYKTKRHVHTASDIQVKKPIYSNSVARWRNYESHLEPLKNGLNAFSDNITL